MSGPNRCGDPGPQQVGGSRYNGTPPVKQIWRVEPVPRTVIVLEVVLAIVLISHSHVACKRNWHVHTNGSSNSQNGNDNRNDSSNSSNANDVNRNSSGNCSGGNDIGNGHGNHHSTRT